jgi:hypothetical protein
VATLTRRAAEHLEVRAPDQGTHLVAYLKNGAADIEIEAAANRVGVVRRQPILSGGSFPSRPDIGV